MEIKMLSNECSVFIECVCLGKWPLCLPWCTVSTATGGGWQSAVRTSSLPRYRGMSTRSGEFRVILVHADVKV